MSRRLIDLSDSLETFVARQVDNGDYASAEDVILAGLRRFQAQEQAEAAKMERFMALVQEGIDEIDRGEGIVVTDIKGFLDEIMADIDNEIANRAA